MRGRLTLGPEIFRSRDEPLAEKPFPNSIDLHPCSEGILAVHQPFGETQPVRSRGKSANCVRNSGLHEVARRSKVTAPEQLIRAGHFQLSEN